MRLADGVAGIVTILLEPRKMHICGMFQFDQYSKYVAPDF